MNGGTRDTDESGKGIKTVTGGVMVAKGFKAASMAAGIKHKDRQDMAMIYSQKPRRSADTFTTNVVEAVPVKWDKNQVTSGVPARTVVIDVGITNAYTGEEGMGYCGQIAGVAAQALGIPVESVLVASTGVIGMQLPVGGTTAGVRAMAPLLDESLKSGTGASEAIMITDTKNKEAAIQFELGRNTVTVGDTCRGFGMTHPNMYTMLSFVTTDATISKELLQEAPSQNIRDIYSMILVDGGTSTSDTILLLTNGPAGGREITGRGKGYHTFCRASKIVNEILAKEIAGDSEGCTALFKVRIARAETEEQARVLAKSITCSSLTRAAVFGHDANWGRILCATGCSGARFNPERVDLYFENAVGKMQIIKDDAAMDHSEEQAIHILSEPAMMTVADIKVGDAKATAWGYDPTSDYIRINMGYRPQYEC